MSVEDAVEDMKYLDSRHRKLMSLRGKLYNSGGDGPIKQNIAEKIAGSGLEYDDMRNLYLRFGKKGLDSVLTKPPLSTISSAPRVTRTMRIVSAILQHFHDVHAAECMDIVNYSLSAKRQI